MAGPDPDGRSRDDLREQALAIAPYYTDAWDPESEDAGTALVELFADIASEVTERVDRAPEKHRVAFYDTLGFDRAPPQSARAPVSVTVADSVEGTVAVPAGTQVVGGTPEQTFEVLAGDGFEATPASIVSAYSVDPERGQIYDHAELLAGDETRLFDGDGAQEHALHVGHADQLVVEGSPDDPTTVRVRLRTDAETEALADLAWAFYGERDGEEGWHRIEEPSPGPTRRAEGAAVPDRHVDLDVDGVVTETTVDGVESRWLRCLVPEDEWGSDRFATEIGDEANDTPPVAVGPASAGVAPTDALLTNGTELTADGEIAPLGADPRPQDAFYVGSAAAFTKAGATVELAFEEYVPENTVEFAVDPTVAWEYWDGDAWSRLDLAGDAGAVRNLRGAGAVRFEVPDDLEPTAVAGHDGHWVRARLVDGGYGRFEGSGTTTSESSNGVTESTDWVTEHHVEAPRFESVAVNYTATGLLQPVEHLFALNNLAYGPDLAAAEQSPFRPFVGLPDSDQALYLGFDGPLTDGPIPLLFEFVEAQYEEGFHPRVRWERRTETGRWTDVDATDGTEGFTERGLVGLAFGDRTRPTSEFGRKRNWLRARVTGDRFEAESADGGESDDGGGGRAGPDPCARRLRTAPPTGAPGRERPTASGLYPNTGWAHNARTVEDEILGGSDGTQDQTASVSAPPAMDLDLWVDELGALSEGQRETFLGDAPGDGGPPVEAVPAGEASDPEAFWVRWTEVDELLGSDGDDRHYTLDPTNGTVTFGDGSHGRIPPRGRDNVRASYRTGGGEAGNVPAGAIAKLKSSIPFVDAVTNPVPADGGADAEAVADVVERAPKALRDRGRAVTEADVERIALDTARQLARAECIPAMDRHGERAPGWVTLVVVPETGAEKPVPSVTLREEVRAAVSERAAATLVADPEQLVVRGPSYVTVSVEATLVTAGAGSLSRVESAAATAVTDFLHPLSGGADGEGWGFGAAPCHSAFYSLLEDVEGVDHVDGLVLRFRGGDTTVSVREGDAAPEMSGDALVHSGAHEFRATTGRGP
jgi:predicted phage baseplate assembly protein